MLLTTHSVDREEFQRETGWKLEQDGACRGDLCVPLDGMDPGDGPVDVPRIADRLGMPIARHTETLAALGPATFGGRALPTADAPDLVLPDLDGNPFDLSSLRGQKVVLLAWSPY